MTIKTTKLVFIPLPSIANVLKFAYVIDLINIISLQQQEINDILEGKDIPNKYTKGRVPASFRYRTLLVRNLCYGGICLICGQWPSYKISYDYDGVKRMQYYCLKHYHDEFIKSNKEKK